MELTVYVIFAMSHEQFTFFKLKLDYSSAAYIVQSHLNISTIAKMGY